VRAEAEFLVLGAGVTGLAAGAELGERAVVLERAARAGGLVRSECFGGYWFDRVLHLLHFQDAALRERVRALLGEVMAPCPPDAWVQTAAGSARYPIQLNLRTLPAEARGRCLEDLARAAEAPAAVDSVAPAYDEYLLRSFGRALCELFYLPYNRKLWRRPLRDMVPGGQTWNIVRPSLQEARRGAAPAEEGADGRGAYNADAFYPRPPAGVPVRGMEVLTRALAERTPGLRTGWTVDSLDPARREVTAVRGAERVTWGYEQCLSTLPLPAVMRMCGGAPPALREAAAGLRHNAVLSAAFCIRGPRPRAPGAWRYYADPSLCFTRLIFMTELDPLAAPEEGWGVMAEIPLRAEARRPPARRVLARARRDLQRTGILPLGCTIIDARMMLADPAYVVFTRGAEEAAEACRAWLGEHGIAALGRYGRWEYASMAQGMAQGHLWAREALAGAVREEAAA
jgi:protoporphyrinogen oxidase